MDSFKNDREPSLKKILINGLNEVREWFSNGEAPFLRSVFDQVGFVESGGAEGAYYLVPRNLTSDLSPPRRMNVKFPTEREELVKCKKKTADEIRSKFKGLTAEYLEELSSSQLLFLLEKFGGAIPAASNGDVAVFDAYKIKAAKATITANRNHPELRHESGYLVINVDISGIQRFIYNVSSRGALKSLRARSFYVELLCLHAVDRIIEAFNLHQVNVLTSGGGNVHILAGKPSNFEELLNGIDLGINSLLMKKFNGRLGVIISSTEVFDDEINGDIAPILKKLAKSSFLKKNRKFDLLFRKEGANFFISTDDPDLNRCSVCHCDYPGKVGEGADPDEDLRCADCEKFVRLGSLIPRIKYVYRETEGGPHCLDVEEIDGKKVFYRLSETGDLTEAPAWIVFEDRDGFVMDLQSASGVLLAGTHMITNDTLPERVQKIIEDEKTQIRQALNKEEDPDRQKALQEELESREGKNPAMLEHLAKSSRGAEYIGALRMDADNVGKMMQSGFGNGATLENLCFFSRSLNYFFRLTLNSLCGQDDPSSGKRMVHLIYAGGDDVFALGAWDDIADLSVKIGEAFSRYACNNPDIGLSGGFTVHKPKFPVRDMAASSLTALNRSKRDLDLCWSCMPDFMNCLLYRQDGYCLRKDSLTPFFAEHKALLKTGIDEELKRQRSPDPSRLKLSFKRRRFKNNLEKPLDEVSEYIQRPHRVFTIQNVPQPPRGFLHTVLRALDIWYSSGLLYMPLISWLLQKQKSHLRSMIDKDSEYSMYELYDWTLHITSHEMISALHVPLTWALLSQKGEDPR